MPEVLEQSAQAVERLLTARSVAVFGASDHSLVHEVALHNLTVDPKVHIFGVNPNRDEALGVVCVPTAAELPETPALALMLVPDRHLVHALRDALAVGISTFVVPGLTGGQRDRQLVGQVVDSVKSAGGHLLGPDCMGVVVPGGASPWIGTLPEQLRSGGVALVSQSGGVAEAIIGLGGRIGLRAAVSIGDEGSVGVADFCRYFARDSKARAVGMFLEAVVHPADLLQACRELRDAGKPVVCLKAGSSAVAAEIVSGHTGGDPAGWVQFAADADDAGVILVEEYADLVETLALLSAEHRIRGCRVAAVTNSGGEAALLADAAERAGIPFAPLRPPLAARLNQAVGKGGAASNPVDAWAPGDVDGAFHGVLTAMAASGDFDLLLVQVDQTPYIGELERRNGAALADALVGASREHHVPGAILSIQPSDVDKALVAQAEATGVAMLTNGAAAVRAIARVGRWQERFGLRRSR